MDNIEYDKIEPQDFIIRVRPYLDEDKCWSGEITILTMMTIFR